jgi:hypothetical protein
MREQTSNRIKKIITILVVILLIAMMVAMLGPIWLR